MHEWIVSDNIILSRKMENMQMMQLKLIVNSDVSYNFFQIGNGSVYIGSFIISYLFVVCYYVYWVVAQFYSFVILCSLLMWLSAVNVW